MRSDVSFLRDRTSIDCNVQNQLPLPPPLFLRSDVSFLRDRTSTSDFKPHVSFWKLSDIGSDVSGVKRCPISTKRKNSGLDSTSADVRCQKNHGKMKVQIGASVGRERKHWANPTVRIVVRPDFSTRFPSKMKFPVLRVDLNPLKKKATSS